MHFFTLTVIKKTKFTVCKGTTLANSQRRPAMTATANDANIFSRIKEANDKYNAKIERNLLSVMTT